MWWDDLRCVRPWLIAAYAILVVITMLVMYGGASPAVVLPLAAGLAIWHGFGAARLMDSPSRRGVYATGAAVLILALTAVDRGFAVMAVVTLAPLLSGLSLRRMIIAAVAGGSALLAAHGLTGSITSPAGLSWTGPDLGASLTIGLGLALAVLCAYSFSELVRTRDELAVSQRRAGMLAERQRLAGDIHDTVTQSLSGIVMLLEGARKPYDTDARVAQALDAARDALTDARRLVWDLRPGALERDPLPEALGRLTEKVAAGAARTVITGPVRPLPIEIEVTLLRTAQEALANVGKHAGAGRVVVTLSYTENAVTLDIEDDGAGFDPDGPHEGFGLAGMRERARAIGGELAVESAPGHGTIVGVQIPVSELAAA